MNLNFKGMRLLVCNYAACIRFYRDILGFELLYQDSNEEEAIQRGLGGFLHERLNQEADLKMGDTRLNLIKRQSMAEIIGSSETQSADNATDNLALILTTQDLEATCSELEAKNVNLITKPMYRPQWGIKTVYLRDPDDNLIGIYQMTDYANV